MIKFAAAAAPLVAMCLFSVPAFAQDAMSGGSMMADDPMATECIEMAAAETDMMKMESMMADCAVKYPDAVAAHCMMKAEMETDAMKKDEIMADCEAMVPGAMAGDAMSGGSMTAEPTM